MPEPSAFSLSVRSEDVRDVLRAREWWTPESLRRIVGDQGATLGYLAAPDPVKPELACLLVNATAKSTEKGRPIVHRAAVIVRDQILVAFDVVSTDREVRWSLEGTPDGFKHTAHPFSNGTTDHVLINIFQTHEGAPVKDISTVDLAGIQIGSEALLCFADSKAARSTLFFDSAPSAAATGEPLNVFIAGMSPGIWEIWRNGWLEESRVMVDPKAFALYYRTNPGGFFLRRIQ